MPASRSLKAKRMILKSLKDRLRNRFNVSVAEVDELDKWQKAVVVVCAVGSDKGHLDGSLQAVLAFAEAERELQVVDSELGFI